MRNKCIIVLLLYLIPLSTDRLLSQDSLFNQSRTVQKNYFKAIQFDNIGGLIIVKAVIQGETYQFLLDTGAANAISKKLYDKLKPPILSEMDMKDGNGALGKMKMVNIKALTFGDVVFEDIPTIVIDSFIVMDCLQIDGFIGSNMLKNSIVQFSYPEEKLILTDNLALLHLSENPVSDIEFLSEQSNPYIGIGLRGDVEGGDFALFDTGFTGFYDVSSINYDTLFSQYPIFKVKNTGFGGNALSVWGFNDAKLLNLSIPEMNINGAIFHNVSTQTSSDEYSKIGNELLKYGKVTVDYVHKKFYFESYATHRDLSEKEFPISPKFEGNKLLVGTIWGEKYAQMVQVNDQIIAIDDVSYENFNPCDWIINGSILDKKNKAELLIKKQSGEIQRILMERE